MEDDAAINAPEGEGDMVAAFALVRQCVEGQAEATGIQLAHAIVRLEPDKEKVYRERLVGMRRFIQEANALLTRWQRLMEEVVAPTVDDAPRARLPYQVQRETYKEELAQGLVTPIEVFEDALLYVLHVLGGAARVPDMRREVEARHLVPLKPGDTRMTRGQTRWQMMLTRTIRELNRKQCIEKVDKEQWALTALGRERLRVQLEPALREMGVQPRGEEVTANANTFAAGTVRSGASGSAR